VVADAIEQNKDTVTEFIDALLTKGDLAPSPASSPRSSSAMTLRSV
jgi:hypothetical protein